jgi:hypothetical protein
VRLVVGGGEVVTPPWAWVVCRRWARPEGAERCRKYEEGANRCGGRSEPKSRGRTVGVKSQGRRRLSGSCTPPITRLIARYGVPKKILAVCNKNNQIIYIVLCFSWCLFGL